MGDFNWAQFAGGLASGLNSYATSEEASKISQAAYEEMMRNLSERFGDYDKLGTAGYEALVPALRGRSALEDIQEDPASRLAQEQTLAELKDIIDSGGLSLADMKAMNDIQRNLNQQDAARRKGLANDFAARGQLGAGAQLAMALQGQQDAAESANQRAEATAAQAQDRRMGATMKRGDFARGMSRDAYGRDSNAAQAHDAINRWNADVRNDSQRYNNTVRGQAFEDELSKARGKTSLTNSMNEAVFGKGKDKAGSVETQGKLRNDFIKAGANAFGSGAQSNGSSSGGGGGSDASGGFDEGFSEDDEINYGDDD